MAVETLAPLDVPTTLNYYARDTTVVPEEKPYTIASDPPPAGKARTNVGQDPQPAVIHDARGREEELGLSLDTSGFQFVKHASQEKEFDDDKRIEDVYYKETEELLKRETGAKRVFIFDHTVRLRPDAPKVPGRLIRGPAETVHIDQTYEASVVRVHHHLGEDAERLLKGRVRIINVWRPIHHPVAHKPLTVSDWRSLDEKNDLVPISLIYPDRVGEVYGVKYNPNLRWYYLSNQTPEEVTLIKCYDSEVDRARLTPHTAFTDSTSPPDAPQRESIEVRALVFDTE